MTGCLASPFLDFRGLPKQGPGVNAGTTLGRQTEERRKTVVLDAHRMGGWADNNVGDRFTGLSWVGKGEYAAGTGFVSTPLATLHA